jgi:hypothetical protein
MPTVAENSAASTASKPKVHRNINMISVNGVDYHLPPGLLHEAFVQDSTNMEGGKFVKKNSLVPWSVVDESDESHTCKEPGTDRSSGSEWKGSEISGYVDQHLRLGDVLPRLCCADLRKEFGRGDGCVAFSKCFAPGHCGPDTSIDT